MISGATQDAQNSVDERIEQLIDVLNGQLELHHRLLECIHEKRRAVRHADLDAIERLCQQENQIAQQLGNMEKKRLNLVGQLTEALEPQARQPMTAARIAACCDDPLRERLQQISEQLRETIAQVKKQSAVLRQAAEALSQHMAGIAQSIRAALSKAVVYGSGGQMEVGAATAQRVDVKR